MTALGCVNDAEVVGECVPDGEAHLVHDRSASARVGLLDGRILVSWVESTSRVGEDGSPEWAFHITWLRPNGDLGEDEFVGYRRGSGDNWVRDGDALVTAMGGVTLEPEPLPVRLEDRLSLVRTRPALPSEITRVALPLTPYRSHDCEFCSVVGNSTSGASAGRDALFPMLATRAGGVAAIGGIPERCLSIYGSDWEPMLFGAVEATVFTRASCIDERERYPNSFGLVRRSDGNIGMLHRVGTPVAGGYVHYLAVDGTGSITVPQTLVGSDEQGTMADSGFDLHGVPLGESGVLFRELSDGHRSDSYMLCYRLRTFEEDGSGAHDIPFQLACMRSARVTRSARLLELSNGYAALAWAERPRLGQNDNLTQITLDTPWDEGIYLTMIRPDGRRGSEIVRVTSDVSTIIGTALDRRADTSGPYPGDMTVSAASEGNHVVLAWRDERVDAPGIYIRSYTCSVTE